MDNIPTVLKAFVIGGGILLIAGTVLLVALLVLRAVGDPPAAGSPQAGPLLLEMPAGARIEQVVPNGRRLILLGVDGSGRQFLAVVDPLTGERISLLHIRPED